MTYQKKLQTLREQRGLKQADLSAQSGINRTTIIKAEAPGKLVKFATVAALVRALGFRDDSPEMREVALLWLESVTHIRFSPEDAHLEAARILAGERLKLGDLFDQFARACVEHHLSPSEVQLLCWAACNQPAVDLLKSARQLVEYSVSPSLELHAAEDLGGQALEDEKARRRSSSAAS